MKRNIILVWSAWFAAIAAGLSPARAQVFTYTFADVVGGTSSSSAGGTAGNMTFSSFSPAGVGANSTAGNVFSFSGWSTGATNTSDTFSGALDPTDYFQFTVAPSSGYQLSITGLTFDAGRTTTGPRQFAVRSGADAYTTNLTGAAGHANVSVVSTNVFQFTDNTDTASYAGNSITLTGSGFTGVTGSVTFRIFAFNAESSGGGFRIDNFSIHASATAVPEPSTYAALAGAGVLAFAVWRRRRIHGR
jgi:hypothetical protein